MTQHQQAFKPALINVPETLLTVTWQGWRTQAGASLSAACSTALPGRHPLPWPVLPPVLPRKKHIISRHRTLRPNFLLTKVRHPKTHSKQKNKACLSKTHMQGQEGARQRADDPTTTSASKPRRHPLKLSSARLGKNVSFCGQQNYISPELCTSRPQGERS